MNMRILKKEWKNYKKDCKRNGVEFLPFDEFIEKVLSEQDQRFETESAKVDFDDETKDETANIEESESDDKDDIIDIPEVHPVKLITRCTCKEFCPCHELLESCTCKEDCSCIKETIQENLSEQKSHQLTFAESENYESYLESLPTDVKYSELEPDLWNTIIHTDTFKNAECMDIATAEKDATKVLSQYKKLFVKPQRSKKVTKKKKTKSSKKSETQKLEKSTETKVDNQVKKSVSKKKSVASSKAKKTNSKKVVSKKKAVEKTSKKTKK